MIRITYSAAHYRVKRLWGKASQYLCVSCDRVAQQWAYDGSDPGELCAFDGAAQQRGSSRPMAYSAWPEFYMPMCRSCHKIRHLANLDGPIKRGRRGVRSEPDFNSLRSGLAW